jgi:poly-gamma-glutamate synthesis protein (capsule biosynthesis protein)
MSNNIKFRMAAVGDINLRDFSIEINPFRNIMPYLETMNLSIGNLEGLLAEPEELYYKPGFTHVGEGHAPNIAKAGFKILNLANNVTYGAEAIKTTLKQLDEAGIAYTGAGMNINEAKKPVNITIDGYRIGMISRTAVYWPFGHVATEDSAGIVPIRVLTAYKPHPRYLELPGAPPEVITIVDSEDLNELTNDIKSLRESVDILVAFFHFGVSTSRAICEYQRTIAHACIDAGADVVFGSHTHVIQPIEVYKNRPIFYGMGQVIFGWDFVVKKLPYQPGLVVELSIDSNNQFNYSAKIVKPDENLEPRFVAFDEVEEEVKFLKSTSSNEIEIAGDKILIKNN